MKESTRMLRGKVVPLDDFKREIVKIIREYGPPGATAFQIRHALGPPYIQDAEKIVVPQLNRMVDRDVLKRTGEGCFDIQAGLKMRGVSSEDVYCGLILEALRHHGGMAFYREIVWYIHPTGTPCPQRHRHRKQYKYEYQKSEFELIYPELQESRWGGTTTAISRALESLVRRGMVRQDYDVPCKGANVYQAGLYNLPAAEAYKVPEWGRNILLRSRGHAKINLGKQVLIDERLAQLDRGLAAAAGAAKYARLMAGLTIDQVLEAPSVQAYMGTWRKDCRTDYGKLQSILEWDHRLEKGYWPSQLELDRMSYTLFEEFPSNEWGIFTRRPNLWSEPDFWYALGDLFHCDACVLSRGEFIPTGWGRNLDT